MGEIFAKRNIAIVFLVVFFGVGILLYLNFFKKSPVLPKVVVEEVNSSKPRYTLIGKSVAGRDIGAYTYGKGGTNLLFIGGIHGGYEWNSVILAYQFMDYLEANPSVIPQNLTITIIPSANPDGVYKVIGKESRFTIADVPSSQQVPGTGRFNANGVDLNRNFDCRWKPENTWQLKTVSAGTSTFSEPETKAIRDFVLAYNPVSVVFWHSQSGTVYASQCKDGILPKTLDIMSAYSQASGYKADKSFDSYAITGDAEGWLASIKIPAITVELKTHTTIDWEQNLAGVKALFKYYSPATKM